MTRIARACICIGFLLLAGCASSPAVRYYNLGPATTNPDKPPSSVYIGLGPMAFPEYLNRPQIVIRTATAELKFSEFDRWAEPLEKSFTSRLAASIDRQLTLATVVAFPYSGIVEPNYRMGGKVLRFDTDESGKALLVVQWGAGDNKGNPVIDSRTSRYEAQATDPDEYDTVVAALDQTVELFSADIVTALTRMLQENQ